MKKLRINVNGTIYDVVVQVLEDDEQAVTGAGFVAPLPAPPAAGRPAPVAAPPRQPTRPAGPPQAGHPDVIAAPLAGTVQKLFVEKGARVEAKTPLVLLDAMKMDTYIYAPRGGEIAEVCVAAGDTVQVGDVLVRYAPEG